MSTKRQILTNQVHRWIRILGHCVYYNYSPEKTTRVLVNLVASFHAFRWELERVPAPRPKFKPGGVFPAHPGGPAIVGERGPEIVRNNDGDLEISFGLNLVPAPTQGIPTVFQYEPEKRPTWRWWRLDGGDPDDRFTERDIALFFHYWNKKHSNFDTWGNPVKFDAFRRRITNQHTGDLVDFYNWRQLAAELSMDRTGGDTGEKINFKLKPFQK